MFRFFSQKSKIVMFCNCDDKSYDVISQYATHTKKRVYFADSNYDDKNLCDQNIIISNDFNVGKFKSFDVKIFIVTSLDDYIEYAKNKEINIDLIFIPHRINYGFMKVVYDDFLNNNGGKYSFVEFLNDCSHCEKNEYILIHTEPKSYFHYTLNSNKYLDFNRQCFI
jgi:hypothetical protein